MDVRSFYGGSRRPRTIVKGRVYRRLEKGKSAAKAVAPRTRKAISAIATRVMKRMVETKHAYQTLFTTWQPVYGSTLPSGGQAQLYNALFGINQGDAADQRNGNIIKPVRVYNDLQIILNDKTADTTGSTSLAYDSWDITVHVWYGVARKYKATNDVIGNAPGMLSNMFDDQFAPGTNTHFSGLFTDQLNPVNTESYLLKHKSVRLFKGPGIANTASGVTSSLYTPQKTTATMRLSWKPPASLHYNDLEGQPQDFAPFFVIGYCHNDSSQAANSVTGSATVLTKPALMIQASQHVLFKDA